jgi:hypothetical protein
MPLQLCHLRWKCRHSLHPRCLTPKESIFQNYIVGKNESTPFDGSVFHDFWVFNISDLRGPVSTASFTVFTYTVNTSFDGTTSDTLSLYDVSTAIADLEATNSNRGDIWTDLASGNLYGTQVYTDAGSNTTKTITLDSALIADLNTAIAAHATDFAIGGTLTPVGAVPEPNTLALMATVLTGFGFLRRRRTN